MCENHNNVSNGEAVRALVEARRDPDTCAQRKSFLLGKVKNLMEFLDSKDQPGLEIIKAIMAAHERALDEDWNTLFYFTPFREESENFYELNAENHGKVIELHVMGKDEAHILPNGQRKAMVYPELRIEDDHKCMNDYWGEAHRIAYTAFMKDLNQESERGKEIFEASVAFLDKAEQHFKPEEERNKRLPYWLYKKLSGFIQVKQEDGSTKKVLDPKSFRARLNLFRFGLYVLTHEQWAYLANWLNALTSWIDFETKEVKQYPCIMQNVMTSEKWISENPEDYPTEIVEVFYTRD